LKTISHERARALLSRENYADVSTQLGIGKRLEDAKAATAAARDPAYTKNITGTTGVDPALIA